MINLVDALLLCNGVRGAS